jgi:hypothetical protein
MGSGPVKGEYTVLFMPEVSPPTVTVPPPAEPIREIIELFLNLKFDLSPIKKRRPPLDR